MNEEDRAQAALAPVCSGTLAKPAHPMSTGALEQALLARFPAADAEAWDRTGITVGDPAAQLTGVAVALDPTAAAVEEAARIGANALVTHHPAYLQPPETFRPDPAAAGPGAVVYRAAQLRVTLMNFHTALDVSERAGRVLPGLLRLAPQRVALPLPGCATKGYGQLCLAGEDEQLTLGRLAARCLAVFGRPPRVWGDPDRPVRRVVTCTGSAGEVTGAALRLGAECLVCGEVKYHAALDASQAGLCIVDLGHDVSELPLAAELLEAVCEAGVPRDSVRLLDQSRNWTHPEATRV